MILSGYLDVWAPVICRPLGWNWIWTIDAPDTDNRAAVSDRKIRCTSRSSTTTPVAPLPGAVGLMWVSGSISADEFADNAMSRSHQLARRLLTFEQASGVSVNC